MPRHSPAPRIAELDFRDRFDTDVGLWNTDGPGHTHHVKDAKVVHPVPNATSMLVAAALLDRLDDIDTSAVLAAVARAQETSGPRRGCPRWYLEEPEPADTNAAFFAGLGLIVLRTEFAEQLSEADVKQLDAILSELKHWFLEDLQSSKAHYPNKYLGDLSCAWMLAEQHGTDAERRRVADEFVGTADYYLDKGWGWGEHLSDCYAWVCLTELAMLRTLARRMPEAMSRAVDRLTAALLEIEDSFGGQPRVPALRSYAMFDTPTPRSFREMVQPLAEDQRIEIRNMPPLGSLFHRKGWHRMVPPRGPVKTDITIPCFDGAVATARVEDDIRIGGMSRFPVMPSAEHHRWGLSWQSFPACLLRPGADWGFLQWQTTEDDHVAAHPAVDHRRAYLRNSLTRTTSPPLVGQTFCLRRDGDMLVLRLMPRLAMSWQHLVDRFRLVDASIEPTVENRDDWSQLLLPWPERTVSVQHVNLSDSPAITLSDNPGRGFDWSVDLAPDDMADCRGYLSLWGVSLNGPVTETPHIDTACRADRSRYGTEAELSITWTWPETTWHIQIDPLSQTPLVDTDPS